MILDNIPQELLLLLNFYSANLNFRSLDSYLEENISRFQAEISLASRLRCTKSVHKTVTKFSDVLNKKWPKDIKKHYLKKIYIAQINTSGIDKFKYVEYLAIQTVKQILPIVFKNKYPDIADRCSKVTTLYEAQNAAWDAARMVASTAHAAAAAAYATALAAARVAAYAINAAANTNANNKLEILTISIQIGIDALCILKNNKYLYLYE